MLSGSAVADPLASSESSVSTISVVWVGVYPRLWATRRWMVSARVAMRSAIGWSGRS